MAEPCTWLPGDPRDLLTAEDKANLGTDLARMARQRRLAPARSGHLLLGAALEPAPPLFEHAGLVLHECGSCWRKFADPAALTDHEARHARAAAEVSSAREATPGHHQPT